MRILLIQASLSVCGAIRCNASGIVWRRKRKSWVFLRAAHVPQAAVRWWNRGIDSENRGSFSRSICGLSPSKKWRAPMRFRIYIVSATVAVSLALSGCGGHGVEVATTSGGIVSGGSGGTGSGTTSGGTTSGGTRIPGKYKGWSGLVSTASGLIAYGDDDQNFVVASAATGKPLWHFNVGQLIHASPMTYSVHGRQYFSIAAGSDVFSFALTGP